MRGKRGHGTKPPFSEPERVKVRQRKSVQSLLSRQGEPRVALSGFAAVIRAGGVLALP